MRDRETGVDATDKVDAIFQLREAVERKTRAEVAVERGDTAPARDSLLDATLNVEAKTQDAIEACHACGRAHADHEPHEAVARIVDRVDNVIDVDFSPAVERR